MNTSNVKKHLDQSYANTKLTELPTWRQSNKKQFLLVLHAAWTTSGEQLQFAGQYMQLPSTLEPAAFRKPGDDTVS